MIANVSLQLQIMDLRTRENTPGKSTMSVKAVNLAANFEENHAVNRNAKTFRSIMWVNLMK